MAMHIIGDFNKNILFCTGSLTKLFTTFVCLSFLSEHFDLNAIVDDEHFLENICTNKASKDFLAIMQNLIGKGFTIRDLCSHYTGLPYTFDPSEEELLAVDQGKEFKHQGLMGEEHFLFMCRNKVTPVYKNRCKFHYSELSIIFFAYLIEQIFSVKMEDLYKKYLLDKFNLKSSLFSRTLPPHAYYQDLSDKYDYPSIGKVNHGNFAYSNGFYTTLDDLKILLEHVLETPVFHHMVDITRARAASGRIMNGLSVELRQVKDDIIYGYEGLSFGGCIIWAYSTQHQKGYLTFTESEEAAYPIIYDQFDYKDFDKVPEHTERIYIDFLRHYSELIENKDTPTEFQGHYHRVKINEKNLDEIFEVGKNFMIIRNPERIQYDLIFAKNNYRIRNKDNTHGAKVGFYQTERNHYLFFDGTLYRKV